MDPERNSDGSVLPIIRAGSKLRNLFQWYAVLTKEEVIASNEWYNLSTVTEWYAENRGLNYEHLETHMSQGLFTKVREENRIYQVKSRGGLLLLFLMLQQLIASNDSIAHTLSQMIETVKIST
jgi:hypothetical protein